MAEIRKATCDSQKEPVSIVHVDDKDWVYIYVNEEEIETEQSGIQYMYDYCEFSGTDLPLEDIQANPVNYLGYTPPGQETPEQRIQKLEAIIAQLLANM